jgi:NADPH:quinone reductase-like Zn-dependent oxidoreductase
MFAHKIAAFTGPDDVVWTEVAEPSGGVVVDVAAAGVSFADLLQTRGAYQMRVALPYTPGMDAAGVVLVLVLALAQVSGWRCWCRTAAGRRSSASRPNGSCRCRTG